jgi:hypothetical protein
VGSVDRSLDNRWNQAVDRLCEAWDRLGPDVTLSWVSALARADVTAEGLLVLDIATRGGDAA